MELNKILCGHALELLKDIPSNSIHCCVTSPPYYALRDYGHKNQMGMERTPQAYVRNMVKLFREVRRVLRKDGTLWLNLGDSYAAGKTGRSDTDQAARERLKLHGHSGGFRKDINIHNPVKTRKKPKELKQKDLIGIPWMVAFALRADGWYLRQDIIWHKPNPMPESVTDRCTKSHEYIFLLTKSPRYYYDYEAIKTEITDATVLRLSQDRRWQKGSDRVPGKTNGAMTAKGELPPMLMSEEDLGPEIPFDGSMAPQKTFQERKGYDHRGTGDKKLLSHSGNFDKDGNIIGGGMDIDVFAKASRVSM